MAPVGQRVDVAQAHADDVRSDPADRGGENGQGIDVQVEVEQVDVVAAVARSGGHDRQTERGDDLRVPALDRGRLYEEDVQSHQSTSSRPR